MAAMCNALYVFLRPNRFRLKNGVSDFGTIGYVNSTLIFVTDLTNINSMKPAEPLFFNSILLKGRWYCNNRECLISG